MSQSKIFFNNFLIMAAFASGAHAELTDVQIVKGICTAQSHIAEGNIGEDLTKRRSRFYCDSAVISFFDNDSKHIMIQFAESASHHSQPIGFAGLMESNGLILDVQNVYLQTGQPIPATDGACKFFFKNKHMTAVTCGSKIDEEGCRTVPVIVFEANPGQ